jgi:YggT family protein
MSFLALIAYWALQVVFFSLLGRLVLELLISFRPGFRPKGIFLPLAEIVMTLTDPPLRFIRRFIKPVQIGSISLDFGWTLLVLVVIFARGFVQALI